MMKSERTHVRVKKISVLGGVGNTGKLKKRGEKRRPRTAISPVSVLSRGKKNKTNKSANRENLKRCGLPTSHVAARMKRLGTQNQPLNERP